MAKEQEYESFERSLKAVEDVTKKGRLIDVLDTACLVRKWFDVYAPSRNRRRYRRYDEDHYAARSLAPTTRRQLIRGGKGNILSHGLAAAHSVVLTLRNGGGYGHQLCCNSPLARKFIDL